MIFHIGEAVELTTKPEWGPGVVLDDPHGDKLKVLFPRVGEKTLSLKIAKLAKASVSEEQLLVLKRFRRPTGKYQSLDELVQKFLHYYPDGFNDENYGERKFKLELVELHKETLNEEVLRQLRDDEEYAEVSKRARHLLGASVVPLPSRFELIRFSDALKDEENQKLFAHSLLDHLYGSGTLEERFNLFARCLEHIGISKWPIQTFFLFIAEPKTHILLKPNITKNAAEACAYELNYNPRPNWKTYHVLLGFCEYLRGELARYGDSLKPRDMIDVHSFIYVAAGGYDGQASVAARERVRGVSSTP
jgi:hypothetical protein